MCTPFPVEVRAGRNTVRVTPLVEAPEGFDNEGGAPGLSQVDVEIDRTLAPPPMKTQTAKQVGELFEFIKCAPEEDMLHAV